MIKLDFPVENIKLTYGVIFKKRKNQECVDLFIINEKGKEVFFTFFHKESPYAKELEGLYQIDFSKLFEKNAEDIIIKKY